MHISLVNSLISLLLTLPVIVALPTQSRADVTAPLARTTPAALPPNGGASIMPVEQIGILASQASAVRRDLVERGLLKSLLQPKVQQTIASTCVDSTANDTYISSLFYYGGANTTVWLCPSANIKLTNAIYFSAKNQTLATQGLPTGSTRATLTVTGQNQSCAVFGLNGPGYDYTTLRNVIVDGARESLGPVSGGIALIEMGGDSYGQQVINVKAFEPRGWSCLHMIEGDTPRCSNALIQNNQIGPSGHAPSGAQQFRRRDTGTYSPGQWADGISMACTKSTVTGNTVTDTTDGGIVIFGAPGSTISNNQIIAQTRVGMGGINMVDYGPFSGSYVGTVVQGNKIKSAGAMIKIGIAIGSMSWGSDNRTTSRTYAGSVLQNQFSTSNGGYFGYAISVAGHENGTISGNTAFGSSFGGVMSSSCIQQLPPAQPFVADPYTTPGCTYNAHTTFSSLVFLICSAPGAITNRFSFWK